MEFKNNLFLPTYITKVVKHMHISFPFYLILTFLSALSGMTIAYFVKSKIHKGLKMILSFSGSFLLGVCIFHLLPEVFENPKSEPGLWIVCGLIFQILLEFLSQGVEHGHSYNSKNHKIPGLVFFSLCIHSFVEGIPMEENNPLIWGIFLHKIPIGMILFVMINKTHESNIIKVFFLLIFALMSPLGSFLNSYFNFLSEWQNVITAFVVGILLHISTTILYENNQGHSFNVTKILITLFGLGCAYVI